MLGLYAWDMKYLNHIQMFAGKINNQVAKLWCWFENYLIKVVLKIWLWTNGNAADLSIAAAFEHQMFACFSRILHIILLSFLAYLDAEVLDLIA